MNYGLKILLDNATTLAERKEILSLTEADAANINNNIVSKLFKSAMEKSYIDFDDIPATKGDITKYKGYKEMVESLSLMRKVAEQSHQKVLELDIVEKSISNIISHRSQFEAGFKLGKDFVMLQYNTLVAACVVATSSIIASYMDFARRVDEIEFKLVNTKTTAGKLCITELERFNTSVHKGDFGKAIGSIIRSNNPRAVGESSVAVIATGVVVGILAAIAGIRLLVHYFYYSRMKISEYLKLQAMFLELNRNNLKANANGMSPAKRDKIIANQQDLINKLTILSDKIKVNSTITDKKVQTEVKKEESGWKLRDIKSDSVSYDNNGVQLL